jgi:hypothetical protein
MTVIPFAPEKGKNPHQHRCSDPHRWLANGLRQIAAAEDAEARTATVEALHQKLARHGRSFRDLAELVERVGFDANNPALEPDSPFTALTLRTLYRRYGSRPEFTPSLVWYGSALRRLETGSEPTLADRRERAQLLARLRMALR